MESTDERKKLLELWLATTCGLSAIALKPMTGDASFRRYFRFQNREASWVVMDAPPPRENCVPFVAIAHALRQKKLLAPEVVAADLEKGFLLLSDFGDDTYLKALREENADSLYQTALNTLSTLQTCREIENYQLPIFTRDFMWQEWAWHKEWFITKLLGLPLETHEKQLDDSYAALVDSAATQPQVFMHRDFHSANLMVLPQKQVGILDFQDAFIGPITYDVVSLLRDCYIDWPHERVQTWVFHYWQLLKDQQHMPDTFEKFFQYFDWMGLQRHLKALLTFARKKVRDQDERYLMYIPRTINYIIEVSARYPQFKILNHYFIEIVQPAFTQIMEKKISCAE